MLDSFEQSERAHEIAHARIPKVGGTRAMNINSYIASLTVTARNPADFSDEKELEDSRSIEKTIGIFVYLRDRLNVKTYGEALELIEQRKLDPSVIKLWIEEGMIKKFDDIDSIIKGYPELKDELELEKQKQKELVEEKQK